MNPILVLRGAADAQRLSQRIEARGASARALPMFRTQALAFPELSAESQEAVLSVPLDRNIDLIFVSRAAVAHSKEYLQGWLDERLGTQGLRVFAVGRATGAAVQEAFPVLSDLLRIPNDQRTEGLLALPELVGKNDAAKTPEPLVVVIKGLAGRETLVQTLREQGRDVMTLDVYERVPEPTAALQKKFPQQASAVIATSAAILQQFTEHWLASGREVDSAGIIVVPSQRIAEKALSWRYTSVLVSPDASDDAIIAVLAQAGLLPST